MATRYWLFFQKKFPFPIAYFIFYAEICGIINPIILKRMKKCLSFLCLLVAIATLQAQTVIYTDNFDSYVAGQQLCSQNNTNWTTWSNAPGSGEDAYISIEQAFSGTNSLKITGTNDIIYRFSNQTSGVFDIEFKYFVPSNGSGAYFNLQHYYNPGIEWAFESFLYNNGNGYVTINNASTNFSFPTNAWFPVKIHVDLDNTSATLTINNVDVTTWPFNHTSENANGLNQLGSVNFYAGAPDNATGTYYVDDFSFTQVTAGNDGSFVFSPNTDVIFDCVANSTYTHTINLSNPGGTPVNYRIVPTYDVAPSSSTQGENILMRYDNTNGGIIFGTTSVAAAVGYTAAEIASQNLVGKSLNRMEFYLSSIEGMLNPKIQIYDMNGVLVGGPGNVVYEQSFVPAEGMNEITLNTPYLLDGRDLWFGIYFEQTEATAALETRPSIVTDDATAPNPNGNWCKTSVNWTHLNDNNPELSYNWAIGAYVSGTPITPWMNITPNNGEGAIAANGSGVANVNITVGASGTVQTGKLHVYSSDLNNEYNVLNVNITSISVGIDEQNQIGIRIFPNPTTDALRIASESINRVEVYNLSGQCILNSTYGENEIMVNTSNWAPGTYVVKVTANGTSKIEKVIVK